MFSSYPLKKQNKMLTYHPIVSQEVHNYLFLGRNIGVPKYVKRTSIIISCRYLNPESSLQCIKCSPKKSKQAFWQIQHTSSTKNNQIMKAVLKNRTILHNSIYRDSQEKIQHILCSWTLKNWFLSNNYVNVLFHV